MGVRKRESANDRDLKQPLRLDIGVASQEDDTRGMQLHVDESRTAASSDSRVASLSRSLRLAALCREVADPVSDAARREGEWHALRVHRVC